MDYLTNSWYAACWAQDLKAGELVARTFLNTQVVLFRGPDGMPYALEDLCPHRFAPLHIGQLLDGGCRIRCAYHGLEFDAAGICVKNPHGSERIPSAAKVRAFPLVEKYSLLWIWMGHEPPDEQAVPDFSVLNGAEQRIVGRDYLRMDAGYQLLVSNLMDLSHANFLHDGILGHAGMIKADMAVESTPQSVTVKRFASNVMPPGLFDLMFKRDGNLVDFWADITWRAPSSLVNDAGVTAPGRPRSDGTGVYGLHFVTPETDTTCHYHFAAVRNNPVEWGEPIDTEVRTKISELRRMAFDEQDHYVLREQQLAISNARRVLKPIALETDAGLVRYTRILGALIQEEKAQFAPSVPQGSLST